MTRDMPPAHEIDRSYYNCTYYAKHRERLDNKDRFTRVKADRVISLLVPKNGEKIIDLGCGVGTMMVMLSACGATMIGMDYSVDSLLIAKDYCSKDAPGRIFRAVCSDGRDIAVRDGLVDGVMAVDFTEHIDDDLLLPMVREVYRILKSGGRFVIYTPSPTHVFERMKKHNIILKEDKSHIGLRTMKQYMDILSEVGFSVRKSYFRPTDIPIVNLIETAVINIPFIGGLARRRICICAQK